MKTFLALVMSAALTVAAGNPVAADEASGQVSEILIKIETPDGPRWFRLGVDLSEVDIGEGTTVLFNYADDTIDAIEVLEVSPDGSVSGAAASE